MVTLLIRSIINRVKKRMEDRTALEEDRQRSREFMKEKTQKWADNLGVRLELDKKGFPTEIYRKQVAVFQFLTTDEDIVSINEIKFGIEFRLWNRKQWAECLDEFLGEDDNDFLLGIKNLLSRPVILSKLIILHIQYPGVLSGRLNDLAHLLVTEMFPMDEQTKQVVRFTFRKSLNEKNLMPY